MEGGGKEEMGRMGEEIKRRGRGLGGKWEVGWKKEERERGRKFFMFRGRRTF